MLGQDEVAAGADRQEFRKALDQSEYDEVEDFQRGILAPLPVQAYNCRMPDSHPHAAAFIEHMQATQQSYVRRDLENYLRGFSAEYFSVQLDTGWGEDKSQLESKMLRDMAQFELQDMQLNVIRDWYAGEIGFGHLEYLTRLRFVDSGRILIDKRRNLIVGRHLGNGSWEIISKIVISAANYFESESTPDI